jgi:hypothetical protein
MGSVAWVNAVRAAHAFCRNPDNPDQCVFVPMKMNLAKRAKGLTYTITQTPSGLAKVDWLGEVDTTADEAVAGGGKPRRVVAAVWLVERFKEKLEWRSKILLAAAAQEGISRDAMFEAKRSLNLPKARKLTETNGDEHWVWWVPENWPPLRGEKPQAHPDYEQESEQ